MKFNKIGLMVFIFVLVNISFVFAQSCPPSIPSHFKGSILYDNETIFKDYEIVAYIGKEGSYIGERGSIGEVINGEYIIDVSPCFGASSGKIKFFINGVKANEEIEYGIEYRAKETEIDLTFDEIPPSENPCGNNLVDAGEVCDGANFAGLSCSNYGFNAGSLKCSDNCINIHIDDCYISNSGNSGGNGGSSGGGGGGGGGGGNPNNNPIITDDLKDEEEEENKTISLNEGEGVKTSPGITGAVIGALGPLGVGIALAFVIIIIGLSIAVFIYRKRRFQ